MDERTLSKNAGDAGDEEADRFDSFHCNLCNRATEHRVCFSRSVPGNEIVGGDPGFEVSWCNTYMVVSCCGCKNFSFVHGHWFSEDTDETGRPVTYQDLYPYRVSRKLPAWMHDALDRLALPGPVASLVQEIYAALHQNLFTLASMGARSLIEHIMIDKIGDKGNFAHNMDAFIAQGYMGAQQKNQLRSALEVGHAVMHRSFMPNRPKLETVLDIAESLIATLYIHPRRAISLQERVPRRTRSRLDGHR